MQRLLSIFIAVSFVLISPHAVASKEGVLVWNQFAISSSGIGTSGPVSASGTQGPEGISSLRVAAFGREFIATSSQLQELQGFFANGMLLSYEQGHEELGGRTVYLSFVKGFTTGVRDTKQVEFNEQGEIKMLKGAGK
jgi:hypothetical protein